MFSSVLALSLFHLSFSLSDTYNEQAFHEALQRLVNRQQARMYSTIHSSGALKSEVKNPNPTHPSSSSTSHHHTSAPHQEESPIDMSFFDDLNYAPVLSLGARRSDSRLHNASGPRYVSKEDFKPQFAMIQSSKPPHPSMKRATQTNVHMQNANDTFNNFIDETTPQWQNEIASAYSQVCFIVSEYLTVKQASLCYACLIAPSRLSFVRSVVFMLSLSNLLEHA